MGRWSRRQERNLVPEWVMRRGSQVRISDLASAEVGEDVVESVGVVVDLGRDNIDPSVVRAGVGHREILGFVLGLGHGVIPSSVRGIPLAMN